MSRMRGGGGQVILTGLILVTVIAVTSAGGLTYLDVLQRISDLRRGDVRTSLRAIRELAVQSGLLASSKNETVTSAPALSDQQPLELRMGREESEEAEESLEDFVDDDEEDEDATITEGRRKGGGGGSNNNIVLAGGGGLGDLGLGTVYDVSTEDGGGKGKKGKKEKKRSRKHKKKKHKKWRKHLKKAAPFAIAILALKALMLHFLLKKLVLATGLSLLLSKKSLLVSSLIALKLLIQQPHSSDKSSESSKLEVVHIPIRKETGFHKKIQLNKFKIKPGHKVKINIQPKAASTQKPLHTFNTYNSGSMIKHTHQQMEDFGGKYIPLGYESTQYQNYDITTPTTFLDSIPEGSEDNYFDVNDLQYIRREGWDGWTGYNRGEEAAENNGYGAQSYEHRPSTEYSISSSYDQPYSYNSHGNGAAFRESGSNGNNGPWGGSNGYNYKQRNLSLMKYRRKRRDVNELAM